MSKLAKCIKIRYLSHNGWVDLRLKRYDSLNGLYCATTKRDDDLLNDKIYVDDEWENTVQTKSGDYYEVIEQYGDSFPE